MKIKLDENLPASAVPRIVALGFDVDTALDEGLGGKSDADKVRVRREPREP